MSLFKKFTDFCAGIAAFVGSLFLLQKYMLFEPLDTQEYIEWLSYEIKYSNGKLSPSMLDGITEAPSKLSQFFTPKLANEYDYRLLAILIVTLAISILVGLIFKKLPFVSFFFSLIPAVEITYLFTKERLYTQIGLFLIAGALHVAGSIFECIIRDKEDGRHRLWVSSRIAILFPVAFCLLCTKIADRIPLEEIGKKLPIFSELAFKLTKPENMEIVTKIGWIYFMIFIVTTLLYNVYFVDAILSAIPVGYTVYLLYSETLTFNPAIFVLLAVICFATQLSLCVCENNLSRKEQMKERAQVSEKSDTAELSQK
jgi:hypothetical protein